MRNKSALRSILYNELSPVKVMLATMCLLAHFEATLDLTAGNLLAHNNISQICFCGQISLQRAAFF